MNQTQPSGFPCKIIEADFDSNIVTLQMEGTYTVSAGQKRLCETAPASAEPVVTLTGAQLLQALDFIAPDRDTDPTQLEGDVTIAYGEGHAHDGKGYYCWLTDYPDEGSIPLDAEAPAAPVSAEPVAYLDAGGYIDVGTDLADEQLAALPKGLLMLAIIGTYGAEGIAAPVAAQAQPDQSLPYETALAELIDKVIPGLDSGDILTDARRVSAALAQQDADKVVENIEAAAKKLADCMDYPWDQMPEQGRDAMRKNAKSVIDAARKEVGQ